jgi:protein AbiQ
LKIFHLSRQFYNAVEAKSWTEVLQKMDRPYAMVVVKVKNNQFAIPFRHNINRREHSHFFPTIELRDENGIIRQCGLDFTKAMIIQSSDIWKQATIDTREFNAIKGKDRVIAHQFSLFVDEYLNAVARRLTDQNFPRDHFLLETSTLQYYHSELDL